MKYIFVVNGSPEKVHILPELRRQISELELEYEIYVTDGVGDGTRYVRMFCEFHDVTDCCIVACGGSGTANEVASALIACKSDVPMAIMQFGTTNDLLKCFPGRDFKSVRALVAGSPVKIDAIKCNDNYSINTINIGFDAQVVSEANSFIEAGRDHPYQRGLFLALLTGRFNRLKIVVDGRKISSFLTLSCVIGNGQYCGGIFRCTPKASLEDGLLDVCVVKAMSLLGFMGLLSSYRKGTHLQNPRFKLFGRYVQGRHVEVSSGKNLVYVSLDGELDVDTFFSIDILQGALNLILPPGSSGKN